MRQNYVEREPAWIGEPTLSNETLKQHSTTTRTPNEEDKTNRSRCRSFVKFVSNTVSVLRNWLAQRTTERKRERERPAGWFVNSNKCKYGSVYVVYSFQFLFRVVPHSIHYCVLCARICSGLSLSLSLFLYLFSSTLPSSYASGNDSTSSPMYQSLWLSVYVCMNIVNIPARYCWSVWLLHAACNEWRAREGEREWKLF